MGRLRWAGTWPMRPADRDRLEAHDALVTDAAETMLLDGAWDGADDDRTCYCPGCCAVVAWTETHQHAATCRELRAEVVAWAI